MESFDYQGKRKDQYESTGKVMVIGCIGMLFVIFGLIIYGIIS